MSRWITVVVDVMKYILVAQAMFVARTYYNHGSVWNLTKATKAVQCSNITEEEEEILKQSDNSSHALLADATQNDNVCPWSNDDEDWDAEDNANSSDQITLEEEDFPINKVLFFPDKTITNPRNRTPCTEKNFFEARSSGSFKELVRVLRTTRKTLDLAIFVLAFQPLAELIAQLKRKGVQIRLIVDSRENESAKSQIDFLTAKHIEIRSNEHSYIVMMHHKFAIIDGRILLNGSFNWTKSAVLQNYDNIMITSVPELVAKYKEQFEVMWQKFDSHERKTQAPLIERIRSARNS